jgi:hypothetical protein
VDAGQQGEAGFTLLDATAVTYKQLIWTWGIEHGWMLFGEWGAGTTASHG